MANQLFPKEIIENSAEANFSKHSVHSKVIYVTVLIALLSGLIALPFIHTDVSVRSSGIIQPLSERNQLTSLVSGKVNKLYIKENSSVIKGQKVVEISAPLLQEKLLFNTRRQQELHTYLSDLEKFQSIDSTSVHTPLNLQTVKYQRSMLQFRQQLRSKVQSVTETKRTFDRNRQLFERDLISKAEHEKTVFALQAARNDFQLVFEQQMNIWQREQVTYQNELNQLETEQQQLYGEQEQYFIAAPVSGTIQNMQGIYEGSFVYPNQLLAEISPDTGLVAECYIPPQDIGLIRKGMRTHFQISAFDYNQWGILTGKVEEISNDITVINNQPMFTVRASLDQTYMELKNGYRGNLKKGMTLQARFTVVRRNLFQLLYDNVDDWLNPQWSDEQVAISANSKQIP
jgi:HlyD family secretion protein